MPRPTVRIGGRISNLSERNMYVLAFSDSCRSVRHGTHQRMAECHAVADRQPPVRFRVDRRHRDA